MSGYRVETLIFDNGERYPILVGEDGMPHSHITLWVTVKLRAVGMAFNTIENKINHVKWFLEWPELEHRDLYSEFKDGHFLDEDDMTKIKSHLAKDIFYLKGVNRKKNKLRDKVVSIFDTPELIDVEPSVGRNHHYNRMTSVTEYLVFIAKLAVSKTPSEEFNQAISKMEKEFKKMRPRGKGKNVLDEVNNKEIPEGLIEEFMAVAHHEHPKNPFKQESVRLRNHLMFELMEKKGIRRGEMLSLKVTEMVLHGDKKLIWVRRTHDDKYDTRKKQPVAKTRERLLRIDDKTAHLLDRYIMEFRAKTPNADKHPYLFVTHRDCPTQGQQISISTFDNTIIPAMRAVDERFEVINPHYLRHYWNETFSDKVDKNNELAAEGVKGYTHIDSSKEAKMRKHQMGHSSEKSGNTYNQRHITQKANELVLAEQKELQKLAEEAREKKNAQGGNE
ncbi:site-specific integrase [Vibrio campbellii]|uniref:site-specific integrase n=1 Tax=Vibrio campbellii TaxID=680 RepID=UPI0006808362|nr:site-specific integrase [Vibrio campbellii]